MAIEVFNRYEKKYMLNAIQYEKLTQAISEYMVVDAYNRDKPFYEICNIYYDTPDNALIRASIEGPVYKEKLRMRSKQIMFLLKLKRSTKALSTSGVRLCR